MNRRIRIRMSGGVGSRGLVTPSYPMCRVMAVTVSPYFFIVSLHAFCLAHRCGKWLRCSCTLSKLRCSPFPRLNPDKNREGIQFRKSLEIQSICWP